MGGWNTEGEGGRSRFKVDAKVVHRGGGGGGGGGGGSSVGLALMKYFKLCQPSKHKEPPTPHNFVNWGWGWGDDCFSSEF